jgi:GNAT superfamily N-acetyltransferase
MAAVIVDVRESSARAVDEYARVPASFEVHEVFECIDDDLAPAGVRLSPRQLENAYIKDYDAILGEHPSDWPNRFADTRWTLLLAEVDGRHAGGAMVVIPVAQPRSATLWDIRVTSDLRRAGVGTALFRGAEAWATNNGCDTLDVETQNINVAACRFYQRQGCSLHTVNRRAYAAFPDEVQLIWRKAL